MFKRLYLEWLAKLTQQAVPLRSDQRHILVPHPTQARDIETRLDREHLAGPQTSGPEAGRFMEIETEPVARAVKEPAPSSALPTDPLGGVSVISEKAGHLGMDLPAIRSWT
jgi:hypothetical protein